MAKIEHEHTRAPLPRQRFKVRFRELESFRAAQAIETPTIEVAVINPRRNLLSIAEPELVFATTGGGGGELERQLSFYAHEFGAEVVEDYRYSLEEFDPDAIFAPSAETAHAQPDHTLDDVLEMIGAPGAWAAAETRGAGAVIAVVDTGVNGDRPEFPITKRRGQWSPIGENAWVDYLGHGTMCACIATGTRAAGGEFDGVAPEAGLISCRTHFYDTELATLYDYLGDYAEENSVTIVATNSFGIRTGAPPREDPASDFLPALDDALSRGVLACFSAGNYHQLAGGAPSSCDPTSIWLYKCRDDVLTVATADMSGQMWSYSSRGPGQRAGEPGMRDKPDVIAPTPKNGEVLYGSGRRTLPTWGTSGACPQVAGLLALLVSKRRGVSRTDYFEVIRSTAKSLGHAPSCEGSGQIDCGKAVTAI